MEPIITSHSALGTQWWVEVRIPQTTTVNTLARLLIAHLQKFEACYSRFRPDSLVSRLNRERTLPHPIPAVIDFFSYGQKLYERTDTLFNCLLGEVLIERGYGTGPVTPKTTAGPVPTADLSITPDAITLKNGAFDPGGFGKGYVIDELATLLKTAGVDYFIINGGGDIYGTSEPDGSPLTIHLEHPTEPDIYLGTTTLLHQGFAASSPFKRTWKQGDATHTHIVGETDAASFVIAENARDADAFATACLLATPEQLTTFATQNHLGVARYHPLTNEFTCTNFPFKAL